MNKLILLLLFIPLASFGQGDCLNGSNIYSGEPCGNGVKVKVETNVKQQTIVQRALNLSEEKTIVKTPITADLSEYTHILLVNVSIFLGYDLMEKFSVDWKKYNVKSESKYGYEPIENILSLSTFEIMNPIRLNKKRYKKELNYLKTIKNESYLYFYFNQRLGKGDDINTTFIIRDWKNKTIYNATHINTGLNEILAPLIDY